ncbi:MAG TPA: HAMP domain-containing sensor histidine kinase, partial [Geobacteraceae bacterium]|nr:HAMP domain-containing sensor histidine kinase [Geobacteraceae bacterium]
PLRTSVYRVLSENCRDAPTEITLDGRVYAVLASGVKDGTGNSLGELTEIWDISAEKKEKRQWEEFVAMVAHDLKSPLTVVNGYLQMIKMGVYGELTDKLEPVVEQMEQSGTKLTTMVEDLLGAYQMELGVINLLREQNDIRAILRECHNENVAEANEKRIDFMVSVEAGIPPVYLDGKLITRAFNNLIGNAIKFTPKGGRVSVSATLTEGNLRVEIDDTGIGIPDKDISRVFRKYYRSAGASGFKGTGLGLAISRAIVEAHGGEIGVESTEGKGSRFTVVLGLGEAEN